MPPLSSNLRLAVSHLPSHIHSCFSVLLQSSSQLSTLPIHMHHPFPLSCPPPAPFQSSPLFSSPLLSFPLLSSPLLSSTLLFFLLSMGFSLLFSYSAPLFSHLQLHILFAITA